MRTLLDQCQWNREQRQKRPRLAQLSAATELLMSTEHRLAQEQGRLCNHANHANLGSSSAMECVQCAIIAPTRAADVSMIDSDLMRALTATHDISHLEERSRPPIWEESEAFSASRPRR